MVGFASADTGAVWRDPEHVDRWIVELNWNRPVVVYCVHGHEVSWAHGAGLLSATAASKSARRGAGGR